MLLCMVGAAQAEDAAERDTKQSFEDVSKGATRLDRDGLGGIVWSLDARCDAGDELEQRQCRAVKNARAGRVAGKTFIVSGDAGALTVGDWDGKKKSMALVLSGCVACVEPVLAGGKAMYVVSNKAAPTFSGAVAKAATLHETDRQFKGEADAVKWRTEVVPRLKIEFVVKIAGEKAKWKRESKEGLAVQIVGFRVYDPCDGDVVAAEPESAKAAVDRAACGDAVAEGTGAGDKKPKETKPKEPEVPDELSAAQIKEVMKSVRASADQCFADYGVAGDSKLHVTVAADGSVVAVEVSGDFAGTPTGTCIEKAVKAAAFPRTKKSKQSFKYPIVLR